MVVLGPRPSIQKKKIGFSSPPSMITSLLLSLFKFFVSALPRIVLRIANLNLTQSILKNVAFDSFPFDHPNHTAICSPVYLISIQSTSKSLCPLLVYSLSQTCHNLSDPSRLSLAADSISLLASPSFVLTSLPSLNQPNSMKHCHLRYRY
ncbi:uncharacterized protein PGTG_15073 [Puccinia graminis f. sp. tritici CRL 75-36-700-3]|uniref:Uncharacterized protein n=1 Tax=Puccinia graminis f. sp. tritici (strain CRL 75-36-700-3 / race SCCL) TaxID=418459 RepID=E3KY31_PUCGT|nr:uncharacterized protein PGTG_15073 [Puccinia graminis f. sp. tritici CRL 75-36-700-3]EFP89232.2 hypothetical protein PGTG_15073 [Puccinia graminis f. sp. tritici CRL 75-36-700-3]